MIFYMDRIFKVSTLNFHVKMAIRSVLDLKENSRSKLLYLNFIQSDILTFHTARFKRQTFQVWIWKIGQNNKDRQSKRRRRNYYRQVVTYVPTKFQLLSNLKFMSKILIIYKLYKSLKSPLNQQNYSFKTHQKHSKLMKKIKRQTKNNSINLSLWRQTRSNKMKQWRFSIDFYKEKKA